MSVFFRVILSICASLLNAGWNITKDVYESVCAFSNRDGGHIFLGVKDNGEILGIAPDCIEKMKKDFVTAINNTKKCIHHYF